jgi:hypothetical protein
VGTQLQKVCKPQHAFFNHPKISKNAAKDNICHAIHKHSFEIKLISEKSVLFLLNPLRHSKFFLDISCND